MEVGGKLIDHFLPNATDAAKAKLELLRMQQEGELKALLADTEIAKAQIAVNQAEAASPSMWVAGWRPAVGWVCVSGLAIEFVIGPLITWVSTMSGHILTIPDMKIEVLLSLLGSMLGVAGMRTYEKLNGVASKNIGA
jgi:hypothetical protein